MSGVSIPAGASRGELQRLALLSGALAVLYGIFSSNGFGAVLPHVVLTILKASSVAVLGLIALSLHSRLLGAGLLFGGLGDALLAWSHDAFLYGALAFLAGHLCYIAIFVRAGVGFRGVLREPIRVIAMLVVVVTALVSTSLLVPHDSSMLVPLGIYTGVLTMMTMSSFALPWRRRLAMAGAALFFVSDGFVAWNMFHPDPVPALTFWRSFAGWMIYWAGQAAICFGALDLDRPATRSA